MSYFKPMLAVGRVTFWELARDRILYSSGVVSLILLAISLFASKLTYAQPERITLDFGLASVSIVTLIIGILIGSSMIGKEFERRTIFVALSKPISRMQYLFGKAFGLFGILTVNWVILSVLFLGLLKFVGGEWTGVLMWGLVLALFQGFMAASIAICVASYTTAAVAVMITSGIYFMGTNVSEMKYLAAKFENSGYTAILPLAAQITPNFEHFHLGTKVTYMLPHAFLAGVGSVGYGISLSLFFLVLGGILIQQREN